jgi:hypothetical protein
MTELDATSGVVAALLEQPEGVQQQQQQQQQHSGRFAMVHISSPAHTSHVFTGLLA